jgi:serine/threonine protein kinase
MADNGVVNLNHFRLLRVVGKGAFGKVRIVEKKDTGLTFALKYIRKEEGTHSFLKLMQLLTASPSGSFGKCPQYHP